MGKDPDAVAVALRRSLVSESREQHSVMVVEPLTDQAGSYGARAQPALERLLRRGRLSMRQAVAGQRVYAAYALGIVGARDGEAGGCTVHDPGGYRDRQLDAATQYRRLRTAVGLRMWPIVFAVCCEDWSVERFANERGGGTDRKGWIAVLRIALDIAADHIGID